MIRQSFFVLVVLEDVSILVHSWLDVISCYIVLGSLLNIYLNLLVVVMEEEEEISMILMLLVFVIWGHMGLGMLISTFEKGEKKMGSFLLIHF